MIPLVWKYDSPWLHPGVAVAFTDDGELVGAYRKRYRRYRVTLNLFGSGYVEFRTEDAAREHLQKVADRRWYA